MEGREQMNQAIDIPSFEDWRIRTLLVEDNDLDAAVVDRLLARAKMPSFEVERAPTLAAAIERLRQGGLDVVVLDLELPATLHRQCHVTPPPLSEHCPHLPRREALQALVSRALQKDPALRYADAAEMQVAVAQVRQKLLGAHGHRCACGYTASADPGRCPACGAVSPTTLVDTADQGAATARAAWKRWSGFVVRTPKSRRRYPNSGPPSGASASGSRWSPPCACVLWGGSRRWPALASS